MTVLEGVVPRGWFGRFTAAFAEGIGLALVRFPVTSAAIAGFAALLSLAVEAIRFTEPDVLLRAESALAAAGAVAAAVALFGESRGWAFIVRHGASLAVAVLVGAAVLLGARFGVFAPPLVAAACLVVPLAPHFVGSNPLRFWTFVHWGAFGCALAFVSVVLFVLGVTAILEMVRYLFDVGIPQRAYEHLYVVACAFVGPLFALGRVPRDLTEEVATTDSTTDRLSSGLGVLQDWIAAPLALVVALVLHVYAAKIVLTGELPKNQIGWIVGSFALFALTVRVAAHPFLGRGGAATRLFGRVWAATLALPLILLAYGVWLRVSAEGVTGERYYLGLAALSAGLVVLAQLAPRLRCDIRAMAAIPVALLFVSSFGPWGVAATVARSQAGLLLRDFPNISPGDAWSGSLTEEQRQTARSRIVAADDVGALPMLLTRIDGGKPNALADLDENDRRTAFLERFGLGYGAEPPSYETFTGSKLVALDVAGYDTVFTNLSAYASELTSFPTPDGPPELAVQNHDVEVRYRGVVDRFDAAPVVKSLPDNGGSQGDTVAPFVAEVRTRDGRSLRLFVRSASFDPLTLGGVGLGFDLALRRDEWPAAPPPASLGGDGQR